LENYKIKYKFAMSNMKYSTEIGVGNYPTYTMIENLDAIIDIETFLLKHPRFEPQTLYIYVYNSIRNKIVEYSGDNPEPLYKMLMVLLDEIEWDIISKQIEYGRNNDNGFE
jgi:hypothetical protein